MAVGGYEHGSLKLLLRMNNMGSLLAWLSSWLVDFTGSDSYFAEN
jgi:hypothetical protein